MKQMSLAYTEFDLVTKKILKYELLGEVNLVITWFDLLALTMPHAPTCKTGWPASPTELMLRINLLQQFFGHFEPAKEDALDDIPLYQELAHMDASIMWQSDENRILRFRHLLEEHGLGQQIWASVNAQIIERSLMLKASTLVVATLFSAPSLTKNDSVGRGPKIHRTRKGDHRHFAMNGQIGMDTDSGLVYAVMTTVANAHDITQEHALLHGEKEVDFADSGYRGVQKREEIQAQHPDVHWHISMMPGQRKTMDKNKPVNALRVHLKKLKVGIRAKVKYPFRVIKCHFGHCKVRYRELANNPSQLLLMFALSNWWMAHEPISQGPQS